MLAWLAFLRPFVAYLPPPSFRWRQSVPLLCHVDLTHSLLVIPLLSLSYNRFTRLAGLLFVVHTHMVRIVSEETLLKVIGLIYDRDCLSIL